MNVGFKRREASGTEKLHYICGDQSLSAVSDEHEFVTPPSRGRDIFDNIIYLSQVKKNLLEENIFLL